MSAAGRQEDMNREKEEKKDEKMQDYCYAYQPV